MERQQSLFSNDPDFTPNFGKPPAQQHSETSKAAAEEIETSANAMRRRVLEFLRQQLPDGATDEEGTARLLMNPSTYRPRRIELVERHQVRDSGRKRKTASGREVVVWEATS